VLRPSESVDHPLTAERNLAGLVSVIVPFHGDPGKLLRAVESVAAQTVAVAEVLVVDDADPNGPSAVALLQAHDWPFRLRTFAHERNQGPGDARNTGWLAADPRVAYLAFLDADDTWHPRKIAVQTAWMLDHPAFSWSAHRCEKPYGRSVSLPVRHREIGMGYLLLSNPVATPTVMTRRDILPRFREGWRYCEDLLLWLDWLASGHRGAMLDLPLTELGRRPKTPGGMTGQLAQMHDGELRVIETLKSEGRLSAWAALGWRSSMRLKYLLRRIGL
jgi:glycosyltransferase involved in cell wall biosynthesis